VLTVEQLRASPAAIAGADDVARELLLALDVIAAVDLELWLWQCTGKSDAKALTEEFLRRHDFTPFGPREKAP